MNYSLAAIVYIEALDAKARGLFPHCLDRDRAPFGIACRAPRLRRDHVIDGCERQLGVVDRCATRLELANRSNARQLMHQMPVHMKKAHTAGQVRNDMCIPDL